MDYDQDSDGVQTFAEQKMELGEAFGTKKAKKAIQAVAENAMLAARSRGKLDEDARALVHTIKDSSEHMATREELQAAMLAEIEELQRRTVHPEEIELETVVVTPTSRDIAVRYLGLAWVPFVERDGRWARARARD